MAVTTRTQTLIFDTPKEAVLRMLTDASFYQRKYEALGLQDISVQPTTHDNAPFAVLARFKAHTELPLPSWAKRVLPDTIGVEQMDYWSVDSARGGLQIHLQGTPVRISAAMGLSEEGDKVINTVQWRFDCPVPLVGKKLAEFVADDVCTKAERDHGFGRTQAERYR
ncbi:DUF2505 domain-containing protein [Algiphilus sp.]|uniref:DUF2505 domain-containing protein n=1 Tax=Algiphilus sp. TaxID=1872431 RepID=UPI002A5D31CB|nr:DUF2505 domain-containing protein [Pseudomonadota bacterium]